MADATTSLLINANEILTMPRIDENKRLKRNEYMKNYMRQYRAKKKIVMTRIDDHPHTGRVWGE